MKKRCLTLLLVAIGLLLLLFGAFSYQSNRLCEKYPEVDLKETLLYLDDDSNLVGCIRDGNVFTSLTSDPNIYFSLGQSVEVYSVTIDSTLLNSQSEFAQVFFISETGVWSDVSFFLNESTEYVESKDNSKMVAVRLDFSSQPDCSFQLNRIVINNHAQMLDSLEQKYIRMGATVIVLTLLILLLQGILALELPKLERLRIVLLQIVRYLFLASSLLVLLLVVVYCNSDYRIKRQFLISNIWMLLLALFLIFVSFCQNYITKVRRERLHRSQKIINCHRTVVLGTVILGLLQLLVAYNIYFETDWDADVVVRIAKAVAENRSIPENIVWYLSLHPNNAFLTLIYSLLLRINTSWSIFEETHSLYCLIIPNIVIACLTCYLVYRTARLFTSEKFSLWAWAVSVGLIGGSPWFMIPYSDSLALIIPLLSVFLYFTGKSAEGSESLVYRFLALTISAVGYMLKPQCAIPLLACIIYEVLEYLRTKSFQYVKQIAVLIAAVLVVFISVNSTVLIKFAKHGVNFNDDLKIGISHYLMMGMNQTSEGSYSQEDSKFSASITSAKERSAANMQVFKSRIQEAGIDGMGNHLRKKIMSSYNDGGFSWGFEGVFYKTISELPNQTVAPFLRELLYSTGKYYIYYVTAQQFVWLLTMAAAAASALKGKKNGKNSLLSVMFMSLIGIFLWMLLFECRARYLYIFVPLYCVLAGIGLENLRNLLFPNLDKQL